MDEEKLGVSKTYDRQRYDDVSKRNKYKDEIFNGQKTIRDRISGKDIHRSVEKAKNKYGNRKYTEHISDVDHIIPEETVYNRVKNNPFMKDSDVKNIANAKKNYRVVNSKYNRSKGAKSNFKVALDGNYTLNERKQIVLDGVMGEVSFAKNVTKTTVINASKEFGKGVENAVVPIITEGAKNLVLVAMGEKDIEEAFKDFSKLSAKVAGVAGSMRVLTVAIEQTVKDTAIEAFMAVENSVIGPLISAAIIFVKAASKYFSGELSGKEFINELQGGAILLVTNVVGFTIGQFLCPIPILGGILGSIVASISCTLITSAYNFAKVKISEVANIVKDGVEDERVAIINRISSEAMIEIKRERENLQSLIRENNIKEIEAINKGISAMCEGAIENNIEKMNFALDEIMNVFNGKVKFKNKEEFDEFFDNEEAIFVF